MPDRRRDLCHLESRLAWLAAAVSSPRISRSLEKQIHAELRRVQKKLTAIQAFVLAEQRLVKVKRAKRVKRVVKVGRGEVIEKVEDESNGVFDVKVYSKKAWAI